jgi:outer membrane receptor protein involved in Fe transport
MIREKNQVARAVKAILGSALGLAGGVAVISAQAASEDEVETVYVTGSRIARTSDFENPAPVVTFNKDEIAKSGYNNLNELLEQQPFVGNGTFSTRGNNQDSTANGASSVSLRGLGADATLVLVNGRRVAVSSFAQNITTNFVDINTLPVAAVERLEVLKDGASAVYGADAVAGVVNVILRKDFDGFEVAGGGGFADGYDEYNASAIWGSNGEDSNVTLILDYFQNSTLENKERGYFGTANQSPRGGEDFRSSRGYPGRFIVTSPSGTGTRIDPACPPERDTGTGTCVYDFGPWNLLVPEAERTGLMLLGNKRFGAVEFFTEIAAQHNTSIAQGAPTPLDETAALTVPITNPGNPYPDATAISVGRYRTVDAGARQWNIQTDNLRGVFGLRGDINSWKWEISAQRARSESEQTGSRQQGWVRTDYLQQQIDAGLYNPFGATTNPDSVLDAIRTSLVRQGKSELTEYQGQISGELFDLPGGRLAMATGVEYREESIKDIPDEQFQRGLIFGTEAVTAKADRNNWSAFVEFSLPLLKSLELNIAARYDDYSDFGDTTNPKISARWSPIESLAFRASWGTGFRAPSLAQIGLGPSQESQFFTDVYGCAVNPVYCANTDYNIVFSGNPNLKAEESENLNVGVAWKPSDMFQVSVDYWDIKQDNKIDEVPFGYLYQQFCSTQESTVCTRGTPLPGEALGQLQTINSTFTNIGQQSTNGIDFSAQFRSELLSGDLFVGLDYAYMLEFKKEELNSAGTGLVSRDLTGEWLYPQDRATLTGDWGWENWGVRASVNYTGSFEDQPDFDFDGVLDYDQHTTRSVGSFTTVDLQFRYTGFKGLTVALGATNLFDETPPFAIGDGDTDLYGYVSELHDPMGQMIYGKLTYRF